MPFGFHPLDLIIVLVIALLIFGPRRLPEIGHTLGKAIRSFQQATQATNEESEPRQRQVGSASSQPASLETPDAAGTATEEAPREEQAAEQRPAR